MTLETFATILSVIAIIVTIIVTISSFVGSRANQKKHYADSFGHAAMVKAARSSMKKEFNEREQEVVTNIIWRNAGVPLSAVLKDPQERYYIYEGLSDPSQYPWDKGKSEYVK